MPNIGPAGYEGQDSIIPAQSALTVTPNNSENLPNGLCRGLYIGGGGNVTVLTPGSLVPVTFTAAPTGFVLPVQCLRVLATGTTATNIVALY